MQLQYHRKETYDNSEQGGTLNKGRSKNHITTNLTGCFGLTGDSFYRAFTDLADTYTGTKCRDTCTDSTTGFGCSCCCSATSSTD